MNNTEFIYCLEKYAIMGMFMNFIRISIYKVSIV